MSGEFAGTLRERVVIERPVAARNAMGLQDYGWEKVASCLAAIALEGAGQESEAMALSALPRYRVVLRKRDGIAIDQRISWQSKHLMIRQLLEEPTAKDRLVLRCEEVRKA